LTDDILQEKAGSIERCIVRVRAKYVGHEAELEHDLDLQDIIVLNLQRACQIAIDMGMRKGRLRRLGLPKDSAEIFAILQAAGLLKKELATSLRRMVGFATLPCTSIASSTSTRYATSSSIGSTISSPSARRCCSPIPRLEGLNL